MRAFQHRAAFPPAQVKGKALPASRALRPAPGLGKAMGAIGVPRRAVLAGVEALGAECVRYFHDGRLPSSSVVSSPLLHAACEAVRHLGTPATRSATPRPRPS